MLLRFIMKHLTTEEYIRFTNEEIQNMIGDSNLINWTYILNKSEKLKK
jgi:hypothetical protein